MVTGLYRYIKFWLNQSLDNQDNTQYSCVCCVLTCRFCRGCIPTLLEVDNPTCPACEREGEESVLEADAIYADKAIQRDLREFESYCINDGCSWEGDFSNYILHEASCEKRLVGCDCGEIVTAQVMTKHLSTQCPLRNISCLFCHQSIQAKEMTDHNQECCLYPVKCPECSLKVPRVNLDVHLDPIRGDCRKSTCRYGCDALNTREHEQECMAKHLRITFERLMMMEERFKDKELADREKDSERVESELSMLSPATTILSPTAKPFFPTRTPAPTAVVESKVVAFAGALDWVINDFSRKRHEAVTDVTRVIYSPPFYKGRNGYRLCACVYLNGDGMTNGRYMSAFFSIYQGEHDAELPWPFDHKVRVNKALF